MAKILLVEDDAGSVTFVSTWLSDQDHEIHVATDGSEGLKKMLSEKFDLVLLDWNLPGKSGVDILLEYRKSGAGTPIIMLTDRKNIDDKELGFNTGADDYLPKPFELTELSARIRALLRRFPPSS